MRKIINWFGKLSATEKTMFVVILLLIVGIIVRWDFVGRQLGETFRHRFGGAETRQVETPADSVSTSGVN